MRKRKERAREELEGTRVNGLFSFSISILLTELLLSDAPQKLSKSDSSVAIDGIAGLTVRRLLHATRRSETTKRSVSLSWHLNYFEDPISLAKLNQP